MQKNDDAVGKLQLAHHGQWGIWIPIAPELIAPELLDHWIAFHLLIYAFIYLLNYFCLWVYSFG